MAPLGRQEAAKKISVRHASGTVVVDFGSSSQSHRRFQAQLLDHSFWPSLVAEAAIHIAAQGCQFEFGFRVVDVFDPTR